MPQARRPRRKPTRRIHGRQRAARKRTVGASDVHYARRALALVRKDAAAAVDYAVTDVAVAGGGPARRCVVFLQQRLLGLPVYDGRRSVVFTGRRAEITGSPVPISGLKQRVPRVQAEDAVRLAFEDVHGALDAHPRSLATFAAAERFSTFEIDERTRASAHLAIFKARRPRLVWIVDLVREGKRRVEVVVAAERPKILRRRETSHSIDAEIRVAPPEPTRGVLIPFVPEWVGRSISWSFNRAELSLPQPVGDVIAAADWTAQHGLNAFCLANRVLDAVEKYLQRSVPIRFELFSEVVGSPNDAAFVDRDRIVLCGVQGQPDRYAAVDPMVVAHEVAHVVMNAVVGGHAHAAPFESRGWSRAVSEGLADFIGLTIWNDACRTMPAPQPWGQRFGEWFLSGGRDYAPYYAGHALRIPANAPAHELGRVVCGALLLARRSIMQASNADVDLANGTSWGVLLHALLALPHQGDRPKFCCVRWAVVGASGPARRFYDDAFDRMGISPNCPHVQEG